MERRKFIKSSVFGFLGLIGGKIFSADTSKTPPKTDSNPVLSEDKLKDGYRVTNFYGRVNTDFMV